MKKINFSKKNNQTDNNHRKITNNTVAQHRERILAGGRKFKYPIQYARHKLVINTAIIVLVAFFALSLLALSQLYYFRNSSRFMYRLTQIIPFPVADVEGVPVLYRDYLVQYRASEYYLNKYGEIKLDTKDGEKQLEYIRRESLDKAEQIAYARKLANDMNIKVTEKEIADLIDKERNASNGKVTQETYDASIRMLYNQSVADYKMSLKSGIILNKVVFAVDNQAKKTIEGIKQRVDAGEDFIKIVESIGDSEKVSGGRSGTVPINGKYSGLRLSDLSNLSKDEKSNILRSVTNDGYFIVHILDKSDTQVDFEFIHVKLSEFTNRFNELKKSNKIKEYITVQSNK